MGAAVCSGALFLLAPFHVGASSLDFRSLRVAAQWAVESQNAQALADILTLAETSGGSFAIDDPFSVADLMTALRAMPGGAALASAIEADASRGQIGGAPRQDFALESGSEYRVSAILAKGEAAFIEARLKSGSTNADIDLSVLGEDGSVLAQDVGAETGVVGYGAFVDLYPSVCAPVTIEVVNKGAGAAEVVLLVPQSEQQICSGS